MITNTIQTKMRGLHHPSSNNNSNNNSISSYNNRGKPCASSSITRNNYKGHPTSPPRSTTSAKLAILLGRFLVVVMGLALLVHVERSTYAADRRTDAVMEQEQERSNRNNANANNNANNNANSKSDHFAACLVLQNEHENQYLTEFMAYHYHVLKLRRLIVWVDPLSTTKPDVILDRWRSNNNGGIIHNSINITVWNQELDIYPQGHPHRKELWNEQQRNAKAKSGTTKPPATATVTTTASNSRHHELLQARNERQAIFYGACLRRLKREDQGHSWTILSHTDEYVLINPELRNSTTTSTSTDSSDTAAAAAAVVVPAQTAPGSVLTWLNHMSEATSSDSRSQPPPRPCIPLTSKQFGTKEVPPEQQDNSTISKLFGKTQEESVDATAPTTTTRQDFLTLRWQYWGKQQHPQDNQQQPPPLIVRKSMVDLSRIPASMLHWKVDAHRPIPHDDICPQLTTTTVVRQQQQQQQRMGGSDDITPATSSSSRVSPFVVHHYAGTAERIRYDHTHNNNNNDRAAGGAAIDTTNMLFSRMDKTNNNNNEGGDDEPQLQSMQRLHSDTIHTAFRDDETTTGSIPQWLEGFVETVGVEQASALLQGVGRLQ